MGEVEPKDTLIVINLQVSSEMMYIVSSKESTSYAFVWT